jgi:hypothetical protein
VQHAVSGAVVLQAYFFFTASTYRNLIGSPSACKWKAFFDQSRVLDSFADFSRRVRSGCGLCPEVERGVAEQTL